MREFRIFYGVLSVLLFVMCFVYHSRLMPVLLLILTLVPAFSFAVLLLSFVSVRFRAAPSEVVVHKYEECCVKLEVRNNFIFPVSPIRIIGDFQSAEETDFSRKIMVTDVPPMGITEVNIPFRFPFRGEYNIAVAEAHIFDVLRIIRFKKKLNINVRIIALPREKNPSSNSRETDSDSESPASVITANRSNMFGSLREYREGDSIRNIHWKLSAKSDELIVKQMEQSVNNSAVIFSDFSAKFDDEFFSRRMLDAVLETSLAVTRQILDGGNSVINCWRGEKEDEKYEATEPGHYNYLYGAFTVLPQTPGEKKFGELITLFSREITDEQAAVFIVTPCVSEELIQTLQNEGLAVRQGVVLLTFEAAARESEEDLEQYIKNETKISLIKINDDDTVFPISN